MVVVLRGTLLVQRQAAGIVPGKRTLVEQTGKVASHRFSSSQLQGAGTWRRGESGDGRSGLRHGYECGVCRRARSTHGAHEAAHVVQQRGGVQLKNGVREANDHRERHADGGQPGGTHTIRATAHAGTVANESGPEREE